MFTVTINPDTVNQHLRKLFKNVILHKKKKKYL